MSSSLDNSSESENDQDLQVYLKKITGFAISTILYVRNFFDEDSYFQLHFGTMKLRLLSHKSKNKNVSQIIEYLKSCFIPLTLRYLKTLVMEIFEKSDTLTPVETYEFNYDYKRKKNLKLNEQNDIDILVDLLKNLEKMKSFSKNQRFYVSFRLYYYDEVTPNDYEPPGFIPYSDSNTKNVARVNLAHTGNTINGESFTLQIKSCAKNLKNTSDHFQDDFSNKRAESLFDQNISM